MPVLTEILKWSQGLPAWQRDALRRLASSSLSENDYRELACLAKKGDGIPITELLVASPLEATDLPSVAENGRVVALEKLYNLKNVNAIIPGQTLSFASTGVTVIYGDNGAGKSGYARVLKRACRARDVKEEVLPNVTEPKTTSGAPEAEVAITVDGRAESHKWIEGKPRPDILGGLSVFDSRCARVYLDEESDIAFQPYGLDLIQDLAQVASRVKQEIHTEANSITTDITAYANLHGPTEVGQIIISLNERTNPTDIERLSNLSETEQARFGVLDKLVKAADPVAQAQAMRSAIARIERVRSEITVGAEALSDEVIQDARKQRVAFTVATNARAIATQELVSDTALLPGTGGAEWKALYHAASAFSKVAYVHEEFPHTEANARCVLCQQVLSDGGSRLLRFKQFMQDETEATVQQVSVAVERIRTSITSVGICTGWQTDVRGDIAGRSPELPEKIDRIVQALRERQEAILKILENQEVEIDSPLDADLYTDLKALSDVMVVEAEVLEESADPEKRKLLEDEWANLGARLALAPQKAAILRSIDNLKKHSALKRCANRIDTTAISTAATSIATQAVSAELEKALNREFQKLDIEGLKVRIKARTERGQTYQKLVLNVSNPKVISQVLSEGEQRALAIASFLAELEIGGSRGGVVFDDPTSSLDHRRRLQVARRLIEEGGRRQVVVFTHDLYLLGSLQSEASRKSVSLSTRTVTAPNKDQCGLVADTLPFEGESTKQRIKRVRQIYDEAIKAQKAGDKESEQAMLERAYNYLRQTWERAVEEILLNGVIERHSPAIHTLKLRDVSIEDDDYLDIFNGMDEANPAVHDQSRGAGTRLYEASALLLAIESLETFRSKIEARKPLVRQRRV